MSDRLARLGLMFAAIALVSAFGTACASDEDDAAADGQATSGSMEDGSDVSVVLTEWAVAVDPDAVPAGEVTFIVENAGTIPHELVVIKSDEPADALPVEGGVVPEVQVEVIGEVEEFPAGETDTDTFMLEAGNYILICNIPAHYEQGMRQAFTAE